ncbi:MAG: hypothetical protein KA141_03880 [Rubrivivax sp.]|nr:hypothetical protein [Rubrivivax sp.]
MNIARTLLRARQWLTCALVTLAASAAFAVSAQPLADDEDPPGRVGRLAGLQGSVSWFDAEQGEWDEAERNRPLTTADRVSTAPGARAELRVGSTVVRLGGGTELEVLRLDDDSIRLQLHSGSLALRVRSREVAAEIELVTQEANLQPQRAGHYRLDREDDITQATVWRGTLKVDDERGFRVETGQRVELWREGRGERAELRHDWKNPQLSDEFSAWVLSDEQREERSASTRYVSPEMTGAEELDRHGRWEQHPEYGAIWLPLEVRAGWAPYRDGRWVWVRPWGWTWVDEAPWGFAPFHYGRWVHWHGRWGWTPGDYIARPVFAPALVAWVGGSHWGVSVNIGGPAIGWLPLAPYEFFMPYYRSTPRYRDRINEHPRRPGHRPPPQVPTGPVSYGNQHAPGAVTVVPRDALALRQPVSRAAINPSPGAAQGSQGPARPWVAAQPPARPVRTPVQMVPGGAQPVPPQMGPQRPAPGRIESNRPAAPADHNRGSGREREPVRDVPRNADRAPDRTPDRDVQRSPERNAERGQDRNQVRESERRPAPPAAVELRHDRAGPPAPQPNVERGAQVQPQRPGRAQGPAAPSALPQAPQSLPQPAPQPLPARPAVQPAPAPAPTAAPAPQPAPPQRQRAPEPERRQDRQERQEERKSQPEARPQMRERDNLR